MLARLLRLYKALQEFFTRNMGNRIVNQRAPDQVEWQAVREVVSVLDEAAQLNTQVQGGQHAFVGKAINDFTVLHQSLTLATQEIRSLDPYDGPRTEVSTADLLIEVRTLLKVMIEDMNKRGLGRAITETEKICLVLDPRYKSCCEAVCLNGGDEIRESVAALVESKLSSFTGSVVSAANAGAGTGSSGGGTGAGGADAAGTNVAGAASGSGGAGEASGAGGGAAANPPAMTRMDKIRAKMNEKVSRPPGDVDAPESRADVAAREFAAYMKEAAPPNNSKFELLTYWNARSLDGVDPSSAKVIVPARWPHIGLLARMYAGVDTTSCQAERNFSALNQVVSDMRAGSLPHKIEQMLLLRLNRTYIPGFAQVEQQLAALKAKNDALADAAISTQNSREGNVVEL